MTHHTVTSYITPNIKSYCRTIHHAIYHNTPYCHSIWRTTLSPPYCHTLCNTMISYHMSTITLYCHTICHNIHPTILPHTVTPYIPPSDHTVTLYVTPFIMPFVTPYITLYCHTICQLYLTPKSGICKRLKLLNPRCHFHKWSFEVKVTTTDYVIYTKLHGTRLTGWWLILQLS